jgi:hypothetical protein
LPRISQSSCVESTSRSAIGGSAKGAGRPEQKSEASRTQAAPVAGGEHTAQGRVPEELKNKKQQVEKREFGDDLFFRLSVFPIHISDIGMPD